MTKKNKRTRTVTANSMKKVGRLSEEIKDRYFPLTNLHFLKSVNEKHGNFRIKNRRKAFYMLYEV